MATVVTIVVYGTAQATVAGRFAAAVPCGDGLVGSAVRAQSGTTGVGLDCLPTDDGPTRSARPYFDAADWLWNPVPEDPALDPQSEAMVAHLATGDHIANTVDFGVTLRDTEDITEDTPRFPVSFAQEGNWGPDPFAGETIPIPEDTPIAPGSDGHLAVADPITNMVYNLWMAQDGGESWTAGWGAMTPLDGDGREENGSSTGAGIARYAAVVRAEDIAAGEIPHALFFSTNMAAPDEVRYPATKTDGSNMDGVDTPIPEGARVQLDPALDLESLGLSEGELTVARALQTYGAYVGDNGGARMGFLFEYVPGSSVYSDAGIEGDYASLESIPWERLRVLEDWNGGQEPDADPPADPSEGPADEPRERSGTPPPTRSAPADEPRGDEPRSDEPRGDEPRADEPTGEPRGGEPRDDEPRDDDPGAPGSGDRPRSIPPTGDDPTPSTTPGGSGSTTVEPLRDIGEPTGDATGATLTVGDGGDHSSIQDAVDAAGPGDTVEIAEGTYDGFSVDTQGTAQGWITIRAEEGAEVVVEGGGGSDQGLVDINGAAYLRLIGLSVRGSDTHGVYGAGTDHVVLRDCEVAGSSDGGIVVLDSTDLLVEGCEVHGNNARGTSASNEALSIVNTDGFEIVGNDVRDNGEEGIDAKYEARNGIIHGNRATGNRGPNIYIDSAHDIEVIGNLAAGATEASKSGIGLAVENYSDTLRLADIVIRDNRIEDNAGAGVDFWIEGSGTMSNITVENNRFSGNGRGAITFATDSFSGENRIVGNIFTGGDEPPGEREGFRLLDNALTEAVGDTLGGLGGGR
ncbi:right-handed parallel beta-helix repeat-containing protein [Pseudonocardia sp.]|uniref:right-handed parallel beta-helix repeat-containing protein n=1 Tax=Pseudonocardia sp. TaxID=60912 RepID=UPI00261E04BB|nr:right-handed parallel beta-helix repeat-containing protein [Pseudonocardia sp.]